MTRKSTIVWIVSAVVVTAGGVGIAIAAVPSSGRMAGPKALSTSAEPTSPATAPISGTVVGTPSPESSNPASPLPSPSSPGSPTSKPVVKVEKVAPHVTYFDWSADVSTLEVGGNVPGLVDTGGSCVVTVTRGDVTVTQSFDASAQAASMECGTMRLASPRFASGTWSLTLGYRSPRAMGTSTSTEVTL